MVQQCERRRSRLKDAEVVVKVAAQHFVGDDRKWSFLAHTHVFLFLGFISVTVMYF